MSTTAVELLASGHQSESGSSTPLDVTANSAPMRLDVTTLVSEWRLAPPWIDVYIETSITADGPWTVLEHRRIDGNAQAGSEANWRSSTRINIGAFSEFVRLRWNGKSPTGFTLACAGTTP